MQRGITVADEIKVDNQVTLRWRDYPGLSGPHHVITRVLKCGRGRQKSQSDAMWETQSAIGCFEDEIGKQAKECEQFLEAGRARKQIFPRAFRKECSIANTLFLAPVRPDCWLLTCRTENWFVLSHFFCVTL